VKKHNLKYFNNSGFHFRFWWNSHRHLIDSFACTACVASCRYIRNMAAKELDDMTECSICTEAFTDPRVLPCIHSFCLKCLLSYGKDRQPGDSMPCPLCRKEFTIPDDGLSGIQKNFFMEKLVHVSKLSVGEEANNVLCDACSGDEASASETSKRASMYCIQCQQKYCEPCSRSHTRMKFTANHLQVEIGKQLQKEEIALKLRATCDIHKDEEIKVFCLECQLAICMMCFIKSHKTHDCSDIEEVSDGLRTQAKSDTDKASELLKKTGEVLPRFEKEKNDLIKHLADVEGEINAAADKLIAAIQRNRVKLLSDVESIKLKRVKQLETVKQEVEQHMTALESFKRHSETLLSSGTACDVTRSANSLHDRADELMMFDVIGHVDNSLPSLNVNFLPSTDLNADTGSLIGSIIAEGLFRHALTVVGLLVHTASRFDVNVIEYRILTFFTTIADYWFLCYGDSRCDAVCSLFHCG